MNVPTCPEAVRQRLRSFATATTAVDDDDRDPAPDWDPGRVARSDKRRLYIDAGIISPTAPRPSEPKWYDQPTLRLDSAGRAEAERELAHEPRRGPDMSRLIETWWHLRGRPAPYAAPGFEHLNEGGRW